MAARAMWKAVVRFAGEAVPVKLYAAVEDRNVRFRLLHDKDLVPVEQRMVHPDGGDEVPADEVRRGFEVEPGVFVLLDEEELAALDPEPSRDVEVLRFLPAAAIDPRWVDRPYALGPDGDAGSYFALAAALAAADRVGVARWVMRKRAYVGALRAEGPYLGLVTLRSAAEVVAASELEAPGGRALDKRERQMAGQLVEALAEPFDPEDYEDRYRARVMELIEAKEAGKVVKMPRARRKRATGDELTAALEASLRKVRKSA